MITFDYNKAKTLRFKISEFDNASKDELKVNARLMMEGFECVFPGVIVNDFIQLSFPALKTIVAEGKALKDSKIIVEAICGDTYLVPFEEAVKIDRPIKIETEIIKESATDNKKKILISLKEEADIETDTKKHIDQEEIKNLSIKDMFDAS